ncbi:MAG: CDP-alcohol phosphatidyltransferase family protein [Bacteroidetes bacterium]|nr:CDP-alcohol phosphatidyltransferase family protein [Bacteroidota bacterium]
MMDSSPLKSTPAPETKEVMTNLPQPKLKVFTDRNRTNFLKVPEQKLLAILCEMMPQWVTPDFLTFVGMVGSVLVMVGFFLARSNDYYFLLSILGFCINWFGDSLDGRIAYFRKKPRKWYGFSLDLNMDFISVVMMGCGFYYYLSAPYNVFAFAVVILYNWTMIMSLMKYKIVDVFMIDSAYLGPTEFRIILILVLIGEMLLRGTAGYFTIVVSAVLFIINVKDFFRLQKLGTKRDEEDKANKLLS